MDCSRLYGDSNATCRRLGAVTGHLEVRFRLGPLQPNVPVVLQDGLLVLERGNTTQHLHNIILTDCIM